MVVDLCTGKHDVGPGLACGTPDSIYAVICHAIYVQCTLYTYHIILDILYHVIYSLSYHMTNHIIKKL